MKKKDVVPLRCSLNTFSYVSNIVECIWTLIKDLYCKCYLTYYVQPADLHLGCPGCISITLNPKRRHSRICSRIGIKDMASIVARVAFNSCFPDWSLPLSRGNKRLTLVALENQPFGMKVCKLTKSVGLSLQSASSLSSEKRIDLAGWQWQFMFKGLPPRSERLTKLRLDVRRLRGEGKVLYI